MKTGHYIKCSNCGYRVETKTVDIQINTTTVFSPWRIDEIADCLECGYRETIETNVHEHYTIHV